MKRSLLGRKILQVQAIQTFFGHCFFHWVITEALKWFSKCSYIFVYFGTHFILILFSNEERSKCCPEILIVFLI